MCLSRLRILDEILGGESHPTNRKDLTRRVNRLLQYSVSKWTIDKDLGRIKEMILRSKHPQVEIIWAGGGYRYSEKGFSLFQDQVTQAELRAFALAAQAQADSLGTEAMRHIQSLGRKLAALCPCADDILAKDGWNGGFEASEIDKGESVFLWRAWCHVLGRTSGRLKLRDHRSDEWRHICPNLIYKDRSACWLIGSDLREGRKGSFVAVRMADIDAFETSNKAYVDGDCLQDKEFEQSWKKLLAARPRLHAWVDIGSPEKVAARQAETGDADDQNNSPSIITLPGAEGKMLAMIQNLAV